ncbi:hypothetical protein CEUSTIGMA_g7017.t1 [Chlamydomonas eustigma]|uniref:Uncharacterized protein n=1 Tax=Chlamydomonas eustigma TaxID=1157962 RepID=A0A250X936_9CHLO|nr:hypothetical protein CEUSTIGMA_g7017.t1 [Chlamydomonas eustigma]|eukprot:GAX79576.1 hypothetical protein CEUSTIGMA_g7017.t1 [Chlamydomonas eustigma]
MVMGGKQSIPQAGLWGLSTLASPCRVVQTRKKGWSGSLFTLSSSGRDDDARERGWRGQKRVSASARFAAWQGYGAIRVSEAAARFATWQSGKRWVDAACCHAIKSLIYQGVLLLAAARPAAPPLHCIAAAAAPVPPVPNCRAWAGGVAAAARPAVPPFHFIAAAAAPVLLLPNCRASTGGIAAAARPVAPHPLHCIVAAAATPVPPLPNSIS